MQETVGDAVEATPGTPVETLIQPGETRTVDAGGAQAARRTKTRVVLATCLVALVFLAFFNTLSGDFVQDDIPQIADAPMPGGFTASNLRRAFSRDFWANIEPDKAIDKTDSVYYRPIFLLALMAGQKVAGTNAERWHMVAVSLHALTVLLVFIAIEGSLAALKGPPEVNQDLQFLAAIATALFAVHPAQSESVAWISGFVGPLSTAFMIAAFICYLFYRKRGRSVALLGMVGLFAMAALTKENALALLLIIPICEFVVFRSENLIGRRVTRKRVLLSLFFIACIYMLVRYRVLGFFFGSNLNLNFPDDSAIGFADVLRTVPALVAEYGRIIVLPKSLTFMYGFRYVREFSVTGFWLPLIGVLMVLAGLVWWAKRVPAARLGLIFLVFPLLPHLNTRAFVSDEIIHDRYLYVSLIGAGILFGAFAVQVIKVRGLRIASACVAVGVLSILVVRQNRQWSNAESLWSRAGQTAPESRLVHIALGSLAEDRRDPVTALAEYEAALKTNPDVIDALNNAAFTSARMGDWKSATKRFERIAGLTPDKAVAHFNLSFAYAVLKKYDDAVNELRRALEIDPSGSRSDEWRGRLEELERVRARLRGGQEARS